MLCGSKAVIVDTASWVTTAIGVNVGGIEVGEAVAVADGFGRGVGSAVAASTADVGGGVGVNVNRGVNVAAGIRELGSSMRKTPVGVGDITV
jgi:hypothetical protein